MRQKTTERIVSRFARRAVANAKAANRDKVVNMDESGRVHVALRSLHRTHWGVRFNRLSRLRRRLKCRR
jgi:hypothetical protein